MRFIGMRHLSGPNVFTASPVTVARLELDELTGAETTGFPGFADRLAALLPGLASHHCAAGRPGGFVEAMARGTYFGHVTEHVALELSGLAGRDVHLGRTMWAGADGRYDVMMECPADEQGSAVPQRLVIAAMAIVTEVLAGREPQFGPELQQIARLAERDRPGVSTAAIAAAARRRGIPVRRIGATSALRLGYGCHRHLVCAALSDQSSAVGVDIAADKMLSKQLLAAAGLPVPDGLVVHSAQEAADAVAVLGAPLVLKPLGGRQGAGVAIGLRTAAEAEHAFCQAAGGAADGAAVLAERYLPGTDYRLLMVHGELAAAAELRPAAVTGDGTHTIGQLVELVNADPRRGPGHSRELTRITLDQTVLAHLDASGLDDHSVPAAGQLVTLRRNANLSTGGTSRDVTDLVHQDVAELCRRAAAVCGLDICGIDLRLADIAAPPHGQPCGVLELNACPGLRMHLAPAEGRPRDVAGAIVDGLYPAGTPARIPVFSVTGTNGKTTTARMIDRVLTQAGLRVGLASTDGVYLAGQLVYEADASGPRSAEMVLDDPTVEAAVLETARGGIVRRGLGYDQADVAVVTNITADHLGCDGIDELDELVHVKALVAEEIRHGGTLVLNADDPLVAALADRPAVRRQAPVIAMFSLQPDSQVLAAHKRAGGLCYEVADEHIVETSAGQPRQLLRVAELPGAFGGRAAHLVANALAAVAACRAAGVIDRDIRQALASFTPCQANPGRGNMYRAGASPVIVDYGHNEAALAATGAMVSEVWGGQPAAALTLPGDRRDDLVRQSAAAVAARFGTVVVYEDDDKRDRRPGEMTELITGALRAARPDIVCEQAATATQALSRALALADGAPVLFVYEKLALAREALAAAGAEPWPDADLTSTELASAAAELAGAIEPGSGAGWLAGDGSADYGLLADGAAVPADRGPVGR